MQPKAHTSDTQCTWTGYQTWPEGERWEIIAGVAYNLSPAPSTRHQTVLIRISSRLEQKLSGKLCRLFTAPTDVRLSETDVVQPDLLVVCDPAKIAATHIEGAPDMVMEILSPSTSTIDLREKKALYARAGVREYLVVDPLEHYAIRFLLRDDGAFDEGAVFGAREALTFATLKDLEIPLWEVFELPGPAEHASKIRPGPGPRSL